MFLILHVFLVPTALKRKIAAACRNEVFIKSFHHIIYTRLHRKQLAKEIKEKENLMNFACKKTSHSISKRCFVFSIFLYPLSLSINSLSYSSFLHFLFHLLFLISRSTNFLTFYTFFPSFFPSLSLSIISSAFYFFTHFKLTKLDAPLQFFFFPNKKV